MLHHARRTCARRIEQDLIKALLSPRLPSDIILKILMKECHILQTVLLGVLLAFRHQRLNAFHPDYAGCFAGQRQGKVPHAAEQIEHPIGGLYVQPRQRVRHHLLVHAVVNLDKISRAER